MQFEHKRCKANANNISIIINTTPSFEMKIDAVILIRISTFNEYCYKVHDGKRQVLDEKSKRLIESL